MTTAVLALLQRRGLVQQCTGLDALDAALASGPQTIYTGYDPTADSLHVGHLVTLMALRHLHRAGHTVVALAGGGTVQVGDPTGKSAMRPMLDAAAIGHNTQKIVAQVGRVLGTGERLVQANNADWLEPLGYLSFLRTIGRHFSVNRMLTAETYRTRLQTGLSFLEFNYQLLQAYDFLHLAKTYGCRVQLGGDDQWSNILAGVELCRRDAQLQVHGLTVPLLTTASGAKMGKSAQGAVWLDADKLPVADFFQYWVNVDDRDVARFLRLYTELPEGEIAAAGTREINAQKRVLAYEVTRIVHGEAGAQDALRAANAAFGAQAIPADLLAASQVPRALQADAQDAPRFTLRAALGVGPWPVAAVLQALGWVKSANEGRRLIGQNAVRLGTTTLADPQAVLAPEQLPPTGLELRAGKKRRVMLVA